MIHRLTQFLCVALFGFATAAMAYEIETHADMSKAAAAASAIGIPEGDVLRSLGLQYPIEESIKQVFPNSKGKNKSILELIRDGAHFEDNFPRPLNHFFDPITGRGLGLGSPSPDWALEDVADITDQEYSYKNARQYFYDALTKPSRTERDKNFGKTFQTLGQVIHHIQDMAQPQHVRNDAHCDQWYCIGPFKNPSRYEKYTDLSDVRNNLPFNGYPSATFPTARAFWTGAGQGIAEFTNRNFVSAGTNYQLFNDNPVPGANYLEPIPSGFGPLVPIEQLFNEIGETTTLTGLVGFVENAVYDSRTGLQTTNKRSASLSIYDQDLNTYGVAVPYTDPITGQAWLTDRLFTLNRFTFQAAYPHLITKAVGYSAGLIDYFFRGRLEAEDVTFTDAGITLKVKNAITRSNT